MNTTIGIAHNHSHAENAFAVIPTARRLNAHADYTGKNVTICFLDSGFYPHPDLTSPKNRILAFHDVTGRRSELNELENPEDWQWHGTQTCVAAAGNGHLSDGIYRGLAYDANVVLVNVSDRGRISEESIAEGLRWVLAHRDLYNIRVLNISLGGEEDVSYRRNLVDQLAEQAVASGIVVVVAAGNSGCTSANHLAPPANAPSVLTVGGYNDGNQLHGDLHLYCSSYGPTADGFLKPEVIAPSIWVAAPILPNTSNYRKAEVLSRLSAAPDYQLPSLLEEYGKDAGLASELEKRTPTAIRSEIETTLREEKIVATHYQHVDGTSFAAPIVSSIVAQMLDANPALTPGMIKQILISSATRIGDVSVIRQGYGVVNARLAVEQALNEKHVLDQKHFEPPRIEKKRLVFFYHDDLAEGVCLAGDFNEWNQSEKPFVQQENGAWRVELALPPPGRYRYKFVIDRNRWIEDPSNGLKEPDQYGGFNSIIQINGLAHD